MNWSSARTRFHIPAIKLLVALGTATATPAMADCRGIWTKVCAGSSSDSNWSTREIVIHDPDENYRNYLANAQAAFGSGDLDLAQSMAQQALAEKPGDLSTHALLTQISSQRTLRTARQLNAEGISQLNQGRLAVAADLFRRALQYDGDNETIRQNYNSTVAQMGLRGEYERTMAELQATMRAREAAARERAAKADRDSRILVQQSGKKIIAAVADGCDGLACVQAKIANIQGQAGATAPTLEAAKTEAAIGWSDKPAAVIVVGKTPAGTPTTQPLRPTDGPAKILRAEIDRLWANVAALEVQIATEKDPIKMGALINQQTKERSEARTKELAYSAYAGNYAPDANTAPPLKSPSGQK